MNKGLQALKRLQGEGRVGVYDETDIALDLETIEYHLQAIDIVKKKNVNIRLLQECRFGDYNLLVEEDEKLTLEEYEFLKEVFGNE